jgi:hypothetical protein
MSHCISSVCKDTSYNNIGMPGSAGKLAITKTPSTTAMTASAEMPARAEIKATAERPTTPGTPT